MRKIPGVGDVELSARRRRRQVLAKLTAAAHAKDRTRRRGLRATRPAGYDGRRSRVSALRASKTADPGPPRAKPARS